MEENQRLEQTKKVKILHPKQAIIALDFDSYEEASLIVKNLNPEKFRLKIGKQLYSNEGPKVIEKFNKKGFEIFLDLKLHDIPNTVYKSLKNLFNHNIWMTNIHLFGGEDMMQAAVQAKSETQCETLLVGVTVLTSLNEDDVKKMGFGMGISDLVEMLAFQAKKNDIDGVVCSAKEVSNLKENLGKDFITVTPGIRINEDKNDQARVVTLKEAVKTGSNFIVLGREITNSKNIPKMIKKVESYII